MRLIVLNLLFCVCALPIVTLPAAYGALIAVVMKWARRTPYVEPYRTFFEAWKPHFLAKTGIGLLLTAAPFSIAGYVYLFTKNALAFYALLLVCGLVSFLVQSYFVAQIAVLEIGIGGALKNAFILLGLEWKCTLKLHRKSWRWAGCLTERSVPSGARTPMCRPRTSAFYRTGRAI